MTRFHRAMLVAELGRAENQFLQVLLTRFLLEREDAGVRMEVRFDERTPSIWLPEAKRLVQELMPDFERKAAALQARLDDFLLAGRGARLEHEDEDFCFRHASGGTLPIVRFGQTRYYVLLYRDVPPIGWNIVNGGTATRDELRHPLVAAERELREELLILDLPARRRYVFPGDARSFARCELPAALRLWSRRAATRPDLAEFAELEEVLVPITWIEGRDRLVVQIGAESPAMTDRCFLNINACDFGIEIDRVAELQLDGSVVLCDGEIHGDRLINRPVGLFAVDRMKAEIRQADRREFVPDFFYYDARHFSGEATTATVEGPMAGEMHDFRSRDQIARFADCDAKYDLCPVTRRIIERHLRDPE